MAKGKKGKNKGGRRGDDTDEEDNKPVAAPAAAEGEGKQLTRKQKRLQKQQQKAGGGNKKDDSDDDNDVMALVKGGNDYDDSDDDDDDDDDYVAPTKKNNKRGGRAAAVAAFHADSDDDDDDDSDEEEQLVVNKRGSTRSSMASAIDQSGDEDDFLPIEPVKKGKRGKNNRSAAFDSEEEEEEEDDDEEVEQVAFMIIDDDDDNNNDGKDKKKKKKKDKDRKKEKKKKKDKKKDRRSSKRDDDDDDDDDDNSGSSGHMKDDSQALDDISEKVDALQIETAKPKGIPTDPNRVKTKFELQMEEAMKKKEAAEADAMDATTKKAAAVAAKAAEKERLAIEEMDRQEAAEKEADEIRKKMEEEEEVDFYGHGDDAWTDKSAAIKSAEESAAKGPDRSLTHSADGKKLSNRQRKQLIKEREAAARMAEYEQVAAQASAEGAQFACSQTAFSEKDPQWENSMDINIPNFSISAAGKVLFKDAVLSIGRGRRYGLVGPNGKGKSTLLKMIASGDLKIPPRIDFLYVEQEVVADETPAVEAVLRADAKRWALLKEEESLMKEIDDGNEEVAKIDRLQQVVEELTAMGSDSAEAKARRILFGLGFDMDMQIKPTKMFSGGWRMRISLARALFVEPTLLMLDEPTNHLDLNAVIWLDDYLQRWKKTLLVVSHDQDFLNSITQEILHIEDLKLVSYKGNYDSFKKAEKVKFQQHVKSYEKQEKRIRELKRTGQSRLKAQETMKKVNKREPGARSNKKKNDAIASGVEGATAAELIKRPREYHVKFEFSDVADIGRPVMQVNQVHFRYSPKHPVIFDNVDYGVDMDSRVCIVGPNGAGKSTLLKLMTGELEATSGDVRRNPRLRMGVYNQHFVDRLPMGKTPIEFLRDRFQDEDYQSVRNRLGKYGLEGHAHEVVMRDLSGGQKARVVFVELSLQQPHILLLDEPTNNLDIESIDALIDAVNAFNGGIVVVTHDQRLIENCDCNLWVVEKQKVTPWEKGFEDYKETLLREMEEQIEKESRARLVKLEEAAAAKAAKIALLASKLKAKKR